jgi:hypothetical protein
MLGKSENLDWPFVLCRNLLGEFAGMSEAELEAIGRERETGKDEMRLLGRQQLH